MVIPDAPNLPAWVLAYAQKDSNAVALLDYSLWKPIEGCAHHQPTARYAVASGELGPLECPCERGAPGTLSDGLSTDDEAEARAVYEREAEALLGLL